MRMKQIAALLAASAATFAFAQATPPTPAHGDAAVVSVATGAKGPNLEVANTIAQALAADTSLKQTKVTVAPEEKGILLTGVTPSLQQMNRIVQIATQHAGEGNVKNALMTEEVFIEPNPSGLAQLDASGQQAAQAQQPNASAKPAA